MKLIIAGSRSFRDYPLLKASLSKLFYKVMVHGEAPTEVVSGTARGADRLGERWAKERNISVTRFPANWKDHGSAAGHIRNQDMASYADALIAFWDGASPGTRHMIDTASSRHYNLNPVTVIRFTPTRDPNLGPGERYA